MFHEIYSFIIFNRFFNCQTQDGAEKKNFPIEKLKIFLASDRPTWPFEFLRKRRANSWHHSEEVLDGVLERECIEETCDFAEIHEIDDNLILANQKWNNYKKCHEKYG